MPEIRALRAEDRNALYAICLKTGAVGGDATHLYADPALIGHIYAGPYAALSPETCFVVADETGVGGYIVGTADSAAFEAACERDWWPALCARHPLPPPEDASLDAQRIRHFHNPPRTPDAIARSHPAHLHINLLPHLQGQGWGRRLIDVWRDAVAARGAPACHLVVGRANAKAVAFYRAYGFSELATTDAAITFGCINEKGGAP